VAVQVHLRQPARRLRVHGRGAHVRGRTPEMSSVRRATINALAVEAPRWRCCRLGPECTHLPRSARQPSEDSQLGRSLPNLALWIKARLGRAARPCACGLRPFTGRARPRSSSPEPKALSPAGASRLRDDGPDWQAYLGGGRGASCLGRAGMGLSGVSGVGRYRGG
jgi:hypothetical protein